MTSTTEPQSPSGSIEQPTTDGSNQPANPHQSRKCWVCGYVNTAPFDWDGACKKCHSPLPY